MISGLCRVSRLKIQRPSIHNVWHFNLISKTAYQTNKKQKALALQAILTTFSLNDFQDIRLYCRVYLKLWAFNQAVEGSIRCGLYASFDN
jgi:hypothetical protein